MLFWNLDWASHFPVVLTEDNCTAHLSSYEKCRPFIAAHYGAIFDDDPTSAFSTARLSPRKTQYYRLAGDFFEIKVADRTVGLVIGTPIDWSTYYIRSAGVLPEFQCKQLVKCLLRLLFGHLAAAGVERVEADTSPSNLRAVHILTSLDFNISGSVLSDRWGAQVRFTRFLDRQAEDIFLQQFCTGVPYQLRDRVHRAAADNGPERRQP